MTRHQNDLDPAVAAELEALERALNGDIEADPALADLVHEVRADVPAFDGPARAALDARVDAGFPRESAGWLARLKPAGPLVRPALTVAAVAVLGMAVASTALNGAGNTDQDGGGSLSSVAQDSSVPESAPGGDTGAAAGAGAAAPQSDEDDAAQRQSQAAAPTAPNTGTAPDALADERAGGSVGSLSGARRVERSAELALTTKPAEVQGVANDVIRTVQSLGGVVGSSRIATSPDGGEAFFDLRLPTSKLDAAIGQLSGLASVSGLTQDSRDITGSFVSAGDRLQDARDERAALLKALAKAQTDRQVSSLRARIADSRGRIASAQAELRRLKSRTDKATVALTITGDPAAAEDEDGGGAWTPGDAAGDARRVLEIAAGVAVVAAAALVPLALLTLLASAGARATRRRARERALTTPA